MFVEDLENLNTCIVIDTETVTDQLSRMSKLWEIGIVVVNFTDNFSNVDIVDTKNYLICPNARFDKLDIYYENEEDTVNKIKSAPKFIDLYEEFKKYLDSEFIIGGHNVDYDIGAMNRELSGIGAPLIGKKKIDTLRMSRKLFPKWHHHKLDNLCEEFGLSITNRHRALDDAYATAIALIKMREIILNKNKKQEEVGGLF